MTKGSVTRYRLRERVPYSVRATISVTDLSRDLPTILDRVHYQGESFLIERDGETVAVLEPVTGPRVATWSTLAAALRDVPHPDAAFADDLEQIQRHQPELPNDVWPS
jgi:antitoxin (DNA-binding transcriptional repressor) of toxin-antitoxin stability system